MKDNRRDFIKKSASMAAAISVAGLSSCTSSGTSAKSGIPRPYKKDGGIKFALSMGPESARVPFAKQMGVDYAVSGLLRDTGLDPWDPKLITATKDYWDSQGIKWCVVEGPPILQQPGTRIKLGLDGRDEDILTEQAHKRFIELIYAKKVEFPHLFIWHIPVSVGECLWLAYDERGFLMSGGKVFKKFHKLLIALVGITDNMGMSHGMPLETVVYDDEGYIVEYISKEVSFLPAEEAANELTAFTANKRGEENDVIDRR